jgi:energy-coupling factor transporter ATP-binding protein EcfA2
MIRRLEIAQSLLHRPAVLFLDEPTVGLDPSARETVWERVVDLRDRFHRTMVVTSAPARAAAISRRGGVLERGRRSGRHRHGRGVFNFHLAGRRVVDSDFGCRYCRRVLVLGGSRDVLWLLPGARSRPPRSDRGAALRIVSGIFRHGARSDSRHWNPRAPCALMTPGRGRRVPQGGSLRFAVQSPVRD